MNDSKSVVVRPARCISGALRLPGDKSVSHRYAMLAAIARGRTRLENFSTGADCASTLGCVRALGCAVDQQGSAVAIEGLGAQLHQPAAPLDCGNSGSTMRMLAGILAGQPFTSELFGDDSLSRRPMRRITEPLRAMGAEVGAAAGERPPLRIRGGRLRALEHKLEIPSAQVKTAMLFAGLFAEGETTVEEPVRTRDHGELALRAFGAEVSRQRARVGIAGGQQLHPITAEVPGDISSAAFFLCAAALLPDSELVVENMLLNPTRTGLLDVLTHLGARVSVMHLEEHQGELAGTIRIQHGGLRGTTISGGQTAALIDEIPVIAAIAPYTAEGIEIRDARELRVKESDRIAAIAENLEAMGAHLEEREDGLLIPGGQQLHGAEVDSFGDHRIAMALAIAGLRAQGETRIFDADAARISYPDFFVELDRLSQR